MKKIKQFNISNLEDNFKKQVCEKINDLISNQEEIIKLINKRVETTNEQPNDSLDRLNYANGSYGRHGW